MVPGLFQNMARGQRTTYAETITANNLNKVFMHEAARNRVIFAEAASPLEDEQGERFIVFRNGTLTEGQPGSARFAMTSFAEMYVHLPPRDINFSVALEEEALGSVELWLAGTASHQAELQWRISLVLLVPVLALLAVPLSRVSPREGRFARLVPAILVYIAYFGLLLVSRDLLTAGQLPPWLGLWWVHGVFAALAWALYSGRLGQLPGFRFMGQHV
jgi:lipopolysaccharide export system permease protein